MPRAELLFCFLPAAAVADFGLLVSVKKRHQALEKLKKTGKLVVDGEKKVSSVCLWSLVNLFNMFSRSTQRLDLTLLPSSQNLLTLDHF